MYFLIYGLYGVEKGGLIEPVCEDCCEAIFSISKGRKIPIPMLLDWFLELNYLDFGVGISFRATLWLTPEII